MTVDGAPPMLGSNTSKLATKLQRVLVGLQPCDQGLAEAQATARLRMGDEFPVPDLVYFALVVVLGYPHAGVGEKVRWSIYASFLGEPVILELRKFGFAISVVEHSSIDLRRLTNQLGLAVRRIECYLEPYAKAQIELGAVTIGNHFSEFDTRYRYFRKNADASFAKARRKPRPKKATDTGTVPRAVALLTSTFSHKMRNDRDGFFNSAAMVDAYFSLLEHRLILLRAFVGQPLKNGVLLAFITSRWDAKFVDIVTPTDRRVELALGRMRRLKDKVRNPFSHGGVENDGGSLHFHLPGVGAIPANFTRVRDSVRFSFLPLSGEDHASILKLFDEIDEILSSGSLALPHQLVGGGVDPQFDPASLKRYAEAVQSPEATENFLECWSHDWERHTNMDY